MTQRLVRLYLVCAALACFFFSLQFAANSAAVIETDEGPHVSYAASLADGTLPTIDSRMPQTPGTLPGEYLQHRKFADDAHATIWVANHPPAFYLLAVPVVWSANAAGNPDLGLFTLRLLNAAFNASLVIFAGLLARELLPRHPTAVIAAAGIQLAMSSFTFDAGAVYNDGLAAALGAWALLVTIRCLRRGPDARSVIGLAALCAAAALTRSTGVVITLLCTVGIGVAVVLHRPKGHRIRPAVLSTGLVAGVPALAAGWFYVRNWILYGGPTASQYLVDRFDRRERTELLEPEYLARYLRGQWANLFVQRRIQADMSAWRTIISVVGVVCVLGLLTALAAGLIRRRSTGAWTSDPAGLPAMITSWLLVSGYVVITVIAMLQFLVSGANSHERYVLPVAPILSAVATAGLLGTAAFVRRPMRAQAAISAATLIFFVGWAVFIQFPTAAWSAGRRDNHRLGGALGGTTWPAVFLVLGIIAAAASVAVGVRVLWPSLWSSSGQRRSPGGPAPADEVAAAAAQL